MKHRVTRVSMIAALLATATLAGGCAHESISPAVRVTPHAAEESIETLGAYIRAREPDPMRRLRAVHDWVADNIAYDVRALHTAEVPRNAVDPVAVFYRRAGVCEGYAELVAAIGRAAGLTVHVVRGAAHAGGTWGLHAWNEAWIGDTVVDIDAAWDAGSVDAREVAFTKRYSSAFFRPAPSDFWRDHREGDDDVSTR